jgi:septal ring factor EnvC (AmiA/AmiB activator)
MDMEIYNIINTLVTVFLGGGWFLHWRASRRKANGEAKQTEAQANKEAQEYYNTTLADVNRTLNEVRAERDHYKDERNELRKENHEMRTKYIEIEEKMTQMDLNFKRDISRLGRRIDVLSPFLCGVAGCMHRKKVSLMENIDDNSFASTQDDNEPQNTEKDGNNQEG